MSIRTATVTALGTALRTALRTALATALVGALAAAPAHAANQCHLVDVELTPSDSLQLVAWIERADGTYVDTIFITQQTGSFGLGNRPGRFDFNSGPLWPYGRRITTFPVWAHKKTPQTFPEVIFQNAPDDPETCWTLMNGSGSNAFSQCGENNLSHQAGQSSHEDHYCQPLQPNTPSWTKVADTLTCATPGGSQGTGAYTDKGRFSPVRQSFYPPRADLIRHGGVDSPSVDMYKAMNPFDAVSQATPAAGADTHLTWPLPTGFAPGDYVLFIEVAKEGDFNATYNTVTFPSPPSTGSQSIFWADYGVAYRGQPSMIYRVPFTIGTTETVAAATDYAGYGDPTGADGAIRAPDATITTDTPGSMASRLQLVASSGSPYRVRVDARPEVDYASPAAPGALMPVMIDSASATLSFVAPGDDGSVGTVTGYDIHYRAGSELTADNFDALDTSRLAAAVTPVAAGGTQMFVVDKLLPLTDYWIGVRAYDKCRNISTITIVKLTTADRQSGEVDACFVATAAYGSMMANDVELLRHFRDMMLETNVLGELAVESYYTFGPPVAGVVGQSDLLRQGARDVLAPVIAAVRRVAR